MIDRLVGVIEQRQIGRGREIGKATAANAITGAVLRQPEASRWSVRQRG